MKFKMLSIIFCVVAILATTLSGSVTANATAKSLSTNYTLVNFGSNDATVTVSYVLDNGSAWKADPGNTSFTIPKNYGQTQVRQYFDNTLTAGQGSVMVNSTEQLGAVVQIQARGQTPTSGAYSGYSGGSSKYYVPLAAKNRSTASGVANSQIVIQNTDAANITATVDLYQNDVKSASFTTPSLAQGQSYYFDLSNYSGLPNGWVGSAVVTGNGGKVAVVSNFFQGADTLQSFNGFSAESVGPRWVVPLFFSRLANNLSTVVTVQNLGGSVAAGGVKMTCSRDDTTFHTGPATFTVTNPAALPTNASYSFNPATSADGLFVGTDYNAWGGSCRIDAGSSSVVAIVQMRYVGAGLASAGAYEAISETASQGKTLVVPLVAKRLSNGFATGITIQNMDFSNVANLTLTYTPSFNTSECPLASCDKNGDGKLDANDTVVLTGATYTVQPGKSIQRNLRLADGEALKDGWQGSLVVTSSTNISGIVQLSYIGSRPGDTLMAHDAFVLP